MDKKTVSALVKLVVCLAALVYTVYNTPVSSNKGTCPEGVAITPEMLQRSSFERIQVYRGECFFPADYEEGSRNFITAANAAGAEVMSMKVVDGLSTDVAIFKEGADPKRFLVHISGNHGPEGYLGSAVQYAALQYIKANNLYQPVSKGDDQATVLEMDVSGATSTESVLDRQAASDAPPKKLLPTLVFVHALNPFGFKHDRRVNEQNIDLNRNFLSSEEWSQVKNMDPNYARHIDLKDVINPNSRPFPYIWMNDIYTLATSGFYMLKYGRAAIKTALVSGNYINPTGYSYGGMTHAQSTRNLINLLIEQLDLPHQAEKLVLIDVHTGLGPSGVDTLLDVGFSQDTVEKVFPTEYNNKGAPIGALKASEGGVGDVPKAGETSAVDGDTGSAKKHSGNADADTVSAGYELVKGVLAGNFCNNMVAPSLSFENKICVTQVCNPVNFVIMSVRALNLLSLCPLQEFGTADVTSVGMVSGWFVLSSHWQQFGLHCCHAFRYCPAFVDSHLRELRLSPRHGGVSQLRCILCSLPAPS
jgi:hypothetical protein